jgi:DNA-binding MarR family transcriptional regulator
MTSTRSTIPTAAARRALEEAKQSSAGQLLLRCARLLDEVAIARVNRQAGRPIPRPALTKLFPHIDFEGTRIGTIAERLGVSKQAVSVWIAELDELGVVEIVPDPADGRAKQVRFTRRGLEGLQHGLTVLRQIEEEIAAEVGARPLRALRAALAALAPVLETMARAADAHPTTGPEPE